MAKETVLLYNCGGDEFKTLRALLMMLRVRVRMVEPSRYHLPLEQVAAGKGETAGGYPGSDDGLL